MGKYFGVILLTLITNLSASSTSLLGKEGGNGGDWFCENRIKNVRDDIKSWILRGGATNLILPDGVRTSEYRERMLKAIELVKENIECTTEKVFVGNAEKTCINFNDKKTGKWSIRCNYYRFLLVQKGTEASEHELNRDEHYPFIHHEFAGVAGLEKNNEEESDYNISNQLKAFLKDEIVRKLDVPIEKDNYQTCHDLGLKLIGRFDNHQDSIKHKDSINQIHENAVNYIKDDIYKSFTPILFKIKNDLIANHDLNENAQWIFKVSSYESRADISLYFIKINAEIYNSNTGSTISIKTSDNFTNGIIIYFGFQNDPRAEDISIRKLDGTVIERKCRFSGDIMFKVNEEGSLRYYFTRDSSGNNRQLVVYNKSYDAYVLEQYMIDPKGIIIEKTLY